MDSQITQEQVMTLKVSELKAQLSAKGLECTGIKSALQKRLLEAIKNAPKAEALEVEKKEDAEEIDESTRYTGTVARYFKRKGFGMIIPEGKTEADKDDHIFVHWRQIQSNDEWPFLSQGQKVEYYLGKKLAPKNPKKATFAARVTLEGGNSVTSVDTRVFPNRGLRFQGAVKFFDARKGFGFIIPKETFTFDGHEFDPAKKDGRVYIAREDIKTAAEVDTSPSLKEKAEVEFTIYKRAEDDGKDGSKYGAGDLTKVGGEALTLEDFKPRRTGPRTGPRRKKKGKKGKKRKAGQMMMIPMGGMNMQPQMVVMNGQTFMMMPQGGMNMSNMFKLKTNKKKRRRKNKNKKAAQ